jgi:Tripartite tricarboxylate transporter family receptor/Bifunctional DNA primase/polymerase, N-terminal
VSVDDPSSVYQGIFSKWQPRYAEHGVVTFPVNGDKTPLIRGWQKVGRKGSAALIDKFKKADALGYLTGHRSNVTVLDIDTREEKIAEDAIRRHGQPAIITRTASGKFHFLYRYNGERRRIRPFGSLPIDLLGDKAGLVGGQVQLALPASIQHIRAGKLRALAVTTASRSEALPGIPSASEAVPGYIASNWYGFAAPKNTPSEIVGKLNAEIKAALADPKMKARLVDLGGTPFASSPTDFAKFVADDTAKWAKVIQAANIKPQ